MVEPGSGTGSGKRDDACAFPIVIPANDLNQSKWQPGMTLRDYFAAKAMQSIIAHTELVEDGKFLVGPAPGTSAIENFAGFAYLMADAMLAAREVPND